MRGQDIQFPIFGNQSVQQSPHGLIPHRLMSTVRWEQRFGQPVNRCQIRVDGQSLLSFRLCQPTQIRSVGGRLGFLHRVGQQVDLLGQFQMVSVACGSDQSKHFRAV